MVCYNTIENKVAPSLKGKEKRTMNMKVKSKQEAWNRAKVIFPTDYVKDEVRSKRAGCNIYFSTAAGVYAWISDLGDRLEINLPNGETVNIWVVADPVFSEAQIEDALSVIDHAIYKIDDIINDQLAEQTGIKKARDTLYGAYKKIASILRDQHPDSPLFERYSLE